ncbi:MAG: Crp/Fnr family transcriptional regulator [Verrucomicrobiales bacterium]
MSSSPFPSPPPLLSALTEDELTALHGFGVDLKVPSATPMIEQGKNQDRLYIVINGRLVVSRSNAGQSVDLAELRAGEMFGEMSVFDPGPASATVKSSAACQLWFIDRSAFDQFVDANPAAGAKLLREVAKQLSSRVRVLDANVDASGGRLAEGWW